MYICVEKFLYIYIHAYLHTHIYVSIYSFVYLAVYMYISLCTLQTCIYESMCKQVCVQKICVCLCVLWVTPWEMDGCCSRSDSLVTMNFPPRTVIKTQILKLEGPTASTRKLEHGFRMIDAILRYAFYLRAPGF